MAYDFFSYDSMLRSWKERDKSFRRLDFESAMERIRDECRSRFSGYDLRRRLDGLDLEEDWLRSGSPYFKIWPRMAAELARVEIDILGSFLHLPYCAYSVRLTTRDGPIRRGDGCLLRAMVIGKADPLPERSGWRLLISAQYEEAEGDHKSWSYSFPVEGDKPLERALMEEREHWKALELPDALKSKVKEATDMFGNDHILQVMRLAIAVAFFGLNQHEVIMPDLPRRLVERYATARKNRQESEASKVLREARASGMFGWKVGSEIDLPPAEIRYKDKDRSGDGEGQHLTHGHVRRAHMRMQPKGPRDNPNYELTFVRSHLVRPDLPLREQHGYRIRMPQEVK